MREASSRIAAGDTALRHHDRAVDAAREEAVSLEAALTGTPRAREQLREAGERLARVKSLAAQAARVETDLERLRTESDLEALHGSRGFRRLVARLEGAG